MGIALLSLSGFFQGFSSAKRSLAPNTGRMAKTLGSARAVWPTQHAESLSGRTNAGQTASTPIAINTRPALRVLQVTESGQRVQGAGRMVISGRMADVCAELDRLAAMEDLRARH